MRVGVLGAGSWGTTFSIVLAKNNHDVMLWTNEAIDHDNIKNFRINKRYIPEQALSEKISVTMDLKEAIDGAELLVLAVPSHVVRIICTQIKSIVNESTIILNLAKGFEETTFKRMSEVVFEELGSSIKYIALSGPNIATEIARGLPAGASIAGNDGVVLKDVQKIISNKYFKAYINDDLIGVEVSGAVKNIIAIASGFIEGKNLGINTRAQLVSRGMAEMVALGIRLGGKERTFLGLSGLGDMITTCFSPNSRNFSFGYRIGQGMSIIDALNANHMVVEGVKTCKVVYEMSCEFNIDMPITREIYCALYKNKQPDDVLNSLLSRPLISE